MSRKYSDGFFQLCSALLETHESVSVRRLAPFLEVPRSTLQDGLKRVNHLDPKDLSVKDQHKVATLAYFFFQDTNKTISSVLQDEEIPRLYHYEVSPSDEVSSSDEEVEELEVEHVDDLEDDLLGSFIDDELLTEREIEKREECLKQMKSDGFTDINDYVVRLVRQRQRLQDISREERKVLRNATRSINLLEEVNAEIIDVLNERKSFYPVKPKVVSTQGKPKGVIQLSDLHLGELVNETISNRFDMDVASKRLHKLIERAKKMFKAEGVESVAVFMTGDLINSTRRISEITSYAAPRVKIVFHAYLIIGQVLESLYEDFNVTVAHVVGNESRLNEFFDSTNYLASDNFDLMIYDMLKQTHQKEGLRFVDSGDNPMEQVIEVNGVNFLLVHGNGHRGIATTPKIEGEVQKIKARYAEQDIKIGYVLCGHIHSTYIANGFARSASLVGSNAYAERTLNFTSRASQNLFIVHPDSTVDGVMVDLQEYDGYTGYDFDKSQMTHSTTTLNKPAVFRVE